MSVLQILAESLKLLKKEPKLFIPRFITTTLYSFILLYTAKITADTIKITDVNTTLNPEEATSILNNLLLLLTALLILLLVDLLSYAMYPAMVKDHFQGNKVNLIKSLKEGLSAWKIILVLWITIIIFSALLGLIVFTFKALSMTTGEKIFDYLSTTLVLLSTLTLLVLLFFVMPIAVVEKKGVINSFTEGFTLSMKHKKDVLTTNIFFMALTLTTMALITISQINYSQQLMLLALTAFILTRMLEAVIYTYISVVNPYFYMKVR